MPLRPQHDDGMRIEPPPSEPVASGTIPAAMAAAEPPDDPPTMWSVFQGLTVRPNRVLSVSAFHPNSGVLVLPTTTQPGRLAAGPPGPSRPRAGPSVAGDRPVRRDVALGVLEVLHGQGDAGQRARVAPGGHRLVDGRRRRHGPVGVDGHEGVDDRSRARSIRSRAWATSSRRRHLAGAHARRPVSSSIPGESPCPRRTTTRPVPSLSVPGPPGSTGPAPRWAT